MPTTSRWRQCRAAWHCWHRSSRHSDRRPPHMAGSVLWWGLVLSLLGALGTWSTPPAALSQAPPEALRAQGARALQQGKPEDAIAPLQEAARLYAQQQQPTAQSVALRRVAEAYQALGQYTQATRHLQTALTLVTQEPAQRAAILISLSYVALVTGLPQEGEPYAKAEQYATEAVALARQLDHASLLASALHAQGNVRSASVAVRYPQDQPRSARAGAGQGACDQGLPSEEKQAWSETRTLHRQSATVAQQARQPGMRVRALTHAAIAALRSAQCDEARAWLDEAVTVLPSIAPTHDTIYDMISLGLIYERIRAGQGDGSEALRLVAARLFTDAAQWAERLQDRRALSYALGHLGQLYATAQRYQEALQLSRRAVLTAQQVQAPASLYRWQWQTGRVLQALQDRGGALAAYTQAVDTLQTIRTAVPRQAQGYDTPFREAIRPLYVEHVDLLLQQAAAQEAQGKDTVELLQAARTSMERLKAGELQDYFHDDCVAEVQPQTVDIDALAPTAVIVYPIVLTDRLELLVSLPAGQGATLRRFTVAVSAGELEAVAHSFRWALQERRPQLVREQARKLYTWLVRPLEAVLAAAPTHTLVFVPDGALRTIPLAALHDGTDFLIRKYAVAVTPSLTLTNPQPLARQHLRMLAVGVSEPVAGLPALPHVADEIYTLKRDHGATVLLNKDFTLPSITRVLHAPFSMVHVASHANFSRTASQSFLYTFDGSVTLNQMEKLVGTLRFRTQPLELLTLSACETALGDERAALGLAGVAIKAGARSALATLWRVEDAAAAQLVTSFYQHLREASVSRAVALQRAQLALLQHPTYQDPFFWAPFLLINNWL